jgi:broad specificity phosphatase PhoE
MSTLRRLILVRHGQTDGDSGTRYHGSADVDLSPQGVEQIKQVRHALGEPGFELVVASPLRRAWKSAWLIAEGAPVRLEDGFREIHFGRWEGLTAAEIEASDPILYRDWKDGAPAFEYPSGEPRAQFRERVLNGLGTLLGAPAHSALVVVHKGVIRSIVELLTGVALDRELPPLGGVIELTRDGDKWFQGRRSSNPPGLDAAT